MIYEAGLSYIFIGSSIEGISIAEEIQRGLDKCKINQRKLCNATIWDDIFRPSDIIIERLLAESSLFDFAILVTTPDDYTISRGRRSMSPRDNINLETGIFMATLGRERCIVVRPNNVDIKMPSDLTGLCYVNYTYTSNSPRVGELRSVITEIRSHISDLGPRDHTQAYMSGWGYFRTRQAFLASIDPAYLRPYCNGNYSLLLGCFGGQDKSDMYQTERVVFSDLWPIQRNIPKDVKLLADCAPIASQLQTGQTAWGVLFLVRRDFKLNSIKTFGDLVERGGRVLDGKGCVVRDLSEERSLAEEAPTIEELKEAVRNLSQCSPDEAARNPG